MATILEYANGKIREPKVRIGMVILSTINCISLAASILFLFSPGVNGDIESMAVHQAVSLFLPIGHCFFVLFPTLIYIGLIGAKMGWRSTIAMIALSVLPLVIVIVGAVVS